MEGFLSFLCRFGEWILKFFANWWKDFDLFPTDLTKGLISFLWKFMKGLDLMECPSIPYKIDGGFQLFSINLIERLLSIPYRWMDSFLFSADLMEDSYPFLITWWGGILFSTNLVKGVLSFLINWSSGSYSFSRKLMKGFLLILKQLWGTGFYLYLFSQIDGGMPIYSLQIWWRDFYYFLCHWWRDSDLISRGLGKGFLSFFEKWWRGSYLFSIDLMHGSLAFLENLMEELDLMERCTSTLYKFGGEIGFDEGVLIYSL